MAKAILTAEPLSRNDIPIIAQIFQVNFDYYIHHNTPFFRDYLKALKTVIGLGFTAVLVDEMLVCSYQIYLDPVMVHGKGDFKSNQEYKVMIAQHVSEMVRISTISFQALRYPDYYENFLEALRYLITRLIESTEEIAEAARILNYLTLR